MCTFLLNHQVPIIQFSVKKTTFYNKIIGDVSNRVRLFIIKPLHILITGWNKLHFASARTFVYTMFAVHDCAHKNRVLMSLSCTGAKISAKMPLCQAVYKIQIRTNPQCLMSVIATFNSLYSKQYHVSRSNIGFLCPSYMLRFERAPCMFLFWLWQDRFRTVNIMCTIREPKENYS